MLQKIRANLVLAYINYNGTSSSVGIYPDNEELEEREGEPR
jgi:hypothetical protein